MTKTSYPIYPASSIDQIVPIDPSTPIVHRRDVRVMLTSACLHAGLLVILACWVLPSFSQVTQTLLVSTSEPQVSTFELVDLALPTELPAIPMIENPVDVEVTEVTEIADVKITLEDLTPVPETDIATAVIEPTTISAESLSVPSSVEGAVDRITADLVEKLEKGDLLVVWLLDSSHSLVDDRRRVAARLEPFYERLVTERSSHRHQLASAVVSFGSAMRERVAPTEFGKKIVAAVEDLPVDRTGKENVFGAVAKCAEYYRKSWRDKQLVIVIWTDESGDDLKYLENAIKFCREQRVVVSVVGPSSVLGADTGLHSYTDPKSQSVYQLPVRRGPESAMPERIELGYWYATRWNSGRRGRRGQLPSWLGGQDLAGILSGFSPYALTRLSMQTGGSYTIFDRPEDRGPFDPQLMQRYAPSYGSFVQYNAELQSNPLRKAVIKAAEELEGKKVDAPTMMLFVKSTGPRDFDFMRYYYPPAEFQSKLRSSRGRLTAQALRYSKVVHAALAQVSADGNLDADLEELYQAESSPRWRAWYDLTRGRLLATSVRLEEYKLTVNEISQPGWLAKTTNYAILVASGEQRSDSIFRRRGDEATRLLRRCVDQNRGTPWETLAQRELDFALGVGVRQSALTQNPGGPAARQPNLPRF